MGNANICKAFTYLTADPEGELSEEFLKDLENRPINAVLNALVEECAELGQAACKMNRALGYGLHTSKTVDMVWENFIEEYAQLQMLFEACCDLLPNNPGDIGPRIINVQNRTMVQYLANVKNQSKNERDSS